MIHVLGVYYGRSLPIPDRYDTFGGRWKYLTVLAQYLVLIGFSYSMLVDLFQFLVGGLETGNERIGRQQSVLLRIRDSLMSFWVLITGMIVSVLYCTLAVIDLDGVHPKDYQEINPVFSLYNFYLHLFPLLFNVICVCLVNYQHHSIFMSFISTIVMTAGYSAWAFLIHRKTGEWPYGFLNNNSDLENGVFFFFAGIAAFFLYLLGRKISDMAWYKERIAKKNK